MPAFFYFRKNRPKIKNSSLNAIKSEKCARENMRENAWALESIILSRLTGYSHGHQHGLAAIFFFMLFRLDYGLLKFTK